MPFAVVGLSHHTAPLALRERLHVAAADLAQVLAIVREVEGVGEAVVLSTCNRTEIYALAESPEREAARLSELLAALGKLPFEQLTPHLYTHVGEAAIRHLFRVASSLDSMVIGESQILGQVKAAYAAACAAEAAAGAITPLMERAFNVAKKVRAQTAVGEASTSISSVAVDLARNIFGDLDGRGVLLVGAGKMGRLTLRHLRAAGVGAIYVANRTEARAREAIADLAGAEVGAVAVGLDAVESVLEQVDITVSSISPDRFLLDRSSATRLMRRRRGRPLFVVDIAVPRSFDPGVHEVENAFLYNIDDLETVVVENMRHRQGAAATAERIVEVEATSFGASLRQVDSVPAVRALLARLESIRRGEIERHNGAFTDLGPIQREALEAATRAMMKKVAHGAIVELKRSVADADGAVQIAAIRRALVDCQRNPNLDRDLDHDRDRDPDRDRDRAPDHDRDRDPDPDRDRDRDRAPDRDRRDGR